MMPFSLPSLIQSGVNYLKKKVVQTPATPSLDPNAAAIGIRAPAALQPAPQVAPTASPMAPDPAAQARVNALNQQAAVSAGLSIDSRKKLASGQTIGQITNPTPTTPAVPDVSQANQPQQPAPSAPTTPPPAAVTPPPAPVIPASPTNLDDLEKKYQENLTPSAEELAAANDIQRLNESERQGVLRVQDQPIALDFITGQQAAIERRALAQRQTLQERAAIAQAKRQMALESTKFSLERADKKAEDQQKQADALAKVQQPRFENVGGNLVRIDANGTVTPVYTPPAEGITPYQAAQLALEREKMQQAGVKPLSAEAAKLVANTKSALKDIGLIREQVKSQFGSGRFLDPSYKAAENNVVDVIGRLRSGGVIGDEEYKTYVSLLPSLLESDQTRIEKLNRLENVLNDALQGVTGGTPEPQTTQGLTPQQYESIKAKYPGLSDERINQILGKTNDLSTSQNGFTQKVASEYPKGTTGGQCGDFAHQLVEFPSVGDSLQQKLKSIDKFGIPANEWKQNPQVGDVLITKEAEKTGHVAVVNKVLPDGSVQLSESNYYQKSLGPEKVSHTRILDTNSPVIYGAVRGKLKV